MKTSEKLAIGTQILAARATRSPRPFFVQYSLLNACDARCGYCNCPARENPEISSAEHRRLLAEWARLGAVRIKFLGGEPLLRDDLGDLVEEVRRLGMRAAMVTNGLRIPERMDVVRRLSEVVISIDGDQAAHDAQRGNGTWKRVMRAIEMCAAESIDFFLSAVVTRRSMDQVDWLLATATRLGVMVNFQIPQINPEMYGRDAATWLPAPDEIRSLLARIVAAKDGGAPVLFSSQSYRRTIAWPDYATERETRPGEKSPCTAGTYFVQQEPNGDVYPCVLQIGSFEPKNAKRDGVEAAWKHTQSHSCFACYNTWLNENRAVFDLSPAVLTNFWRNYLRSRKQPPAQA